MIEWINHYNEDYRRQFPEHDKESDKLTQSLMKGLLADSLNSEEETPKNIQKFFECWYRLENILHEHMGLEFGLMGNCAEEEFKYFHLVNVILELIFKLSKSTENTQEHNSKIIEDARRFFSKIVKYELENSSKYEFIVQVITLPGQLKVSFPKKGKHVTKWTTQWKANNNSIHEPEFMNYCQQFL